MINSNNPTNKQSRRFQSLALLTVVTIYLLILAGGVVRSTGSGMGCPDWPKCFGRWIPPTEVSQLPSNYRAIYGYKLKGEIAFNAVKTWIEYANRLLGAFSGFLVLATLVASFSYLRKDSSVFWGSLVAFLLIGANGWLGSRVVATELAQYMVTLHLLLAILVVLVLLFVSLRAGVLNNQTVHFDRVNHTLGWLLAATIILSLSQVILGTQVRNALNEVVQQIGYRQRDNWVAGLDWRFYVHRSFSIIVLAVHAGFIYQLRKTARTGITARLTIILIGLVIVEVLTGIVMAYFAVPAFAQPIHLLLAVLIIGLQFVIWLLLHPTLSSPKRVFDTARLQKV